MFRVAVIVCVLCISMPLYGVEGFVESFRGTGPHSGLDNPGWGVSSLGGDDSFTQDGFKIISDSNTVDDVQLTVVSRDVFGTGSFLETLSFQYVAFGSPLEESAHNTIAYTHVLNEPSFGDIESLEWRLNPRMGEVAEALGLSIYVSGADSYGALLPVSDVFDIQVEFIEATRVVNITYVYTVEGIESSVEFGPFSYGGKVSESQRVVASFSANDGGYIAATLHEWSLKPISEVVGDFDGNGRLNVDDIDRLLSAISLQSTDERFDVDGDGSVDQLDIVMWVHDVKGTYLGDTDLDGGFSSSDLINVFQSGEYEDDVIGNSTWSTGDWNADGEFSTSDLVVAFQDGGYEQGPRAGVSSVPEPTSVILLLLGACGFLRGCTVR